MGIESYKASASLNTSLGSISVAEGMQRSEVSDSIRQVMADIAGGVAPAVLPKKFGAVGDGTTNDTTAITSFNAASGSKVVPDGVYLTTLSPTALDGPFRGPGQIKDTAGKRAPWFSAIKAAPATLGDHTSINTAFNGDVSKSIFQVEHRITGANTLGQPSGAGVYQYTPEAYPHYTVLYNASGWNDSTSSNAGRTAAVAYRSRVEQYGQGDGVCFNASVFASGTRAGSTHFLANPAGVLFNGDFNAATDGLYGNLREIIAHDNGHDIACGGDVINLDRTNATGAKSAWWWGYRVLSVGSQPVNNMFNGTGKFNTGIDLAMAGLDFGTNKAAISLKADDRLYFNNSDSGNGSYTTAFNGWYMTYTTGVGLNIIANGTSVMQIDQNRAAFIMPPQLPTVTVSALPAAAAGNKGREYYVSDANANTRFAAVAGGGANFVKVFSTGSSWLIA